MRRTPPTLATERLLLRGWRGRDVAGHTKMSEDPEVRRCLGKGKTKSKAEALGEIAAHLCHWAALGFGQWALERKEDGESIGRAGFWRQAAWQGLVGGLDVR